MELKISATLKIKPEHEEVLKKQWQSKEETTKEMQNMLDIALKDTDMFESWKITGWLNK